MAAIRSRGNSSTEWRLRGALVRAGIRGWRMHTAELYGRPDFVFDRERLAVFVDGCYWHSCPDCGRPPLSNLNYWTGKLQRNIDRDQAVSKKLRHAGWRVLRIWEHELELPSTVIRKLGRLLRTQPKSSFATALRDSTASKLSCKDRKSKSK